MKTKLSEELFKRYASDPLKYDEEVRKAGKVPDDKYYTVSMWPEHLAGYVEVLKKSSREVKLKKISKSDQKEN
jgi:hypothetical protein